MEIDYPTGAQEPQLRTLWRLAFGDSDEFITGFFASGYCPRRCRCAAENGNVAAALYGFDAGVVIVHNNENGDCRYPRGMNHVNGRPEPIALQ